MRTRVLLAVLLFTTACTSSPERVTRPTLVVPEVGPKAAAQRATQRTLDAVVVPKGATRVPTAPTPRVDQPGSSVVSDMLVDVPRFWKLPGEVRDVANELLTLEPAAWACGFGGTLTHPGVPLDTQKTGSCTDGPVTVQFSVASVSAHLVAIRADAQEVYVPQRSAQERVPGGVTQAELQQVKGYLTRTVIRTVLLRGKDASDLAALVNVLPREPDGQSSCPTVTDESVSRRVTFTGGDATVVITEDGCGTGLGFTLNGHRLDELAESPELADRLASLLP